VGDGLQPALTRLIEIQPQWPGWKQHSVDQRLETAQALTADTSDAILTKNESGTGPPAINAEYKNLIDRIDGPASARLWPFKVGR
jgi:hypothetical protein